MADRSILLFENGVKAEKTLINYKDHLARFLKFTEIKDYDSLASMPSNQLQILIEDYVMYLKKTISPNSISTMIQGVKHFFVMNRVLLNWEIIQKLFPGKIKTQGFKAWETNDIKKMLNATKSLRNKAVIHFIASTGCRVGAFEGLGMKHLEDMGEGCKSILIYEGSKEEYYSFLTPEASQALDNYFDERLNDKERFTDQSPIFRTIYQLGTQKVIPLTSFAIKNIIYRIINSNNTIKRTKITKNYDIQIDHGFRKRFNTILKLENSVNANIAEKIMGHKNGLDGVYLTPTRGQCFLEFKKAIINLTISDEQRQKILIEQKQKELDNVENNSSIIEELKRKFQKEIDDLKYGPSARGSRYAKGLWKEDISHDRRIFAKALALLFELAIPEEKKRVMMKELEQASIDNRKPDFHAIFGIPKLTEEQKNQLQESIKNYGEESNTPTITNKFRPRFRIKNLEMLLAE